METKSADRTVIGETMRIKGAMTSREDVILNGELEGQLDMENRLTIGAKGKVAAASIKVRDAEIAGSVQGNIEASERIVLRQGANLVGDVRTAGIVIEDGAYFKGGIDIARK
jgi:cytoskeletal protein CcmA (bactofilin family)